jgi:oligopeptide transport system substrate-binding protein
VKNEYYHDKEKVKLDEIRFSIVENENTAYWMYRAGELDLAYPIPADVTGVLLAKKDPSLKIAPELATYFFRINTSKKPFDNVKIRRALAMAIDRDTIVRYITQGGQIPAYALVPPGIITPQGDFRNRSGPVFHEDVKAARILLKQGLAEEGLSQMPSFTLLYNTGEAHKRIAEAVKEMWRKHLGIDVKLENVEFQIKLSREKRLDYDVVRAGWVGDYADAMTFLQLFTSDSTQNDTGWTSDAYDNRIAQALRTNDKNERFRLLQEAEHILIDQMPIIPIYFYTKTYAVKEQISGVITPVGKPPVLTYADISKL